MFLLIKRLTIVIVASLLLFVIRPIYWEAYHVQKLATQVASRSNGKMLTEVRDDFLSALKSSGITKIEQGDITISRNGTGWDVGAVYESKRSLGFYRTTIAVDFNIDSSRRSLWVSE